MNRGFVNRELVKDQIEKSIVGEFVIKTDLEKSKYYRNIKVTRDGKTFTRKQLVGSESDEHSSKYLTYDDVKDIPMIYNKLDWLTKDVVKYNDKYYTVRQRIKSEKPVLYEVEMSPADKKMKEEIDEQKFGGFVRTGLKERRESMLEKVKEAFEKREKFLERLSPERRENVKIPTIPGPHKEWLKQQSSTLEEAKEKEEKKQISEANSYLSTNLQKDITRTGLLSLLEAVTHKHSKISDKSRIDYEVGGKTGTVTIGELKTFLKKKIEKETGAFSTNIGKVKIQILEE